jgi:hypothetical protein
MIDWSQTKPLKSKLPREACAKARSTGQHRWNPTEAQTLSYSTGIWIYFACNTFLFSILTGMPKDGQTKKKSFNEIHQRRTKSISGSSMAVYFQSIVRRDRGGSKRDIHRPRTRRLYSYFVEG